MTEIDSTISEGDHFLTERAIAPSPTPQQNLTRPGSLTPLEWAIIRRLLPTADSSTVVLERSHR